MIITAEEARNLSQGSYEEQLKRLDAIIRDAIKYDKKAIRVPYEMININGYNATFKNVDVVLALEKAGYIIRTKYTDGAFSDIWIEVSW